MTQPFQPAQPRLRVEQLSADIRRKVAELEAMYLSMLEDAQIEFARAKRQHELARERAAKVLRESIVNLGETYGIQIVYEAQR